MGSVNRSTEFQYIKEFTELKMKEGCFKRLTIWRENSRAAIKLPTIWKWHSHYIVMIATRRSRLPTANIKCRQRFPVKRSPPVAVVRWKSADKSTGSWEDDSSAGWVVFISGCHLETCLVVMLWTRRSESRKPVGCHNFEAAKEKMTGWTVGRCEKD